MNSRRVRFITALCINTLLTSACFAAEAPMQGDATKQFIRNVFSNVVENMHATEATYATYFSKTYVQYVDGEKLNYADFVAHMKAQKNVMQSVKITVKHIVVEGDKVATIHVIDGVKKNKTRVKAQVNALFQIKDGKIILCDELTHLIAGEKSDKDLGSRR